MTKTNQVEAHHQVEGVHREADLAAFFHAGETADRRPTNRTTSVGQERCPYPISVDS